MSFQSASGNLRGVILWVLSSNKDPNKITVIDLDGFQLYGSSEYCDFAVFYILGANVSHLKFYEHMFLNYLLPSMKKHAKQRLAHHRRNHNKPADENNENPTVPNEENATVFETVSTADCCGCDTTITAADDEETCLPNIITLDGDHSQLEAMLLPNVQKVMKDQNTKGWKGPPNMSGEWQNNDVNKGFMSSKTALKSVKYAHLEEKFPVIQTNKPFTKDLFQTLRNHIPAKIINQKKLLLVVKLVTYMPEIFSTAFAPKILRPGFIIPGLIPVDILRSLRIWTSWADIAKEDAKEDEKNTMEVDVSSIVSNEEKMESSSTRLDEDRIAAFRQAMMPSDGTESSVATHGVKTITEKEYCGLSRRQKEIVDALPKLIEFASVNGKLTEAIMDEVGIPGSEKSINPLIQDVLDAYDRKNPAPRRSHKPRDERPTNQQRCLAICNEGWLAKVKELKRKEKERKVEEEKEKKKKVMEEKKKRELKKLAEEKKKTNQKLLKEKAKRLTEIEAVNAKKLKGNMCVELGCTEVYRNHPDQLEWVKCEQCKRRYCPVHSTVGRAHLKSCTYNY
jgi:hypothetical protein